MTQKYFYVRREIYEQDLASKLSSTRHFADMIRLFKLSYWILLGLMAVALFVLTAFLIFNPTNFFILVPMSVIILISILSGIPRENIYIINPLVTRN